MTRPAHCTCPGHRRTDRAGAGMRRYRIEYRPHDGWVVTGEPLTPYQHPSPRGPWPDIATYATRDDAERHVALWQGRQLILLGVDLNDSATHLARSA